MKVKELMDTKILKIYPDYTARKTIELMHKKKRFRSAVLDKEDKLIGWVMSIDLAILDNKDVPITEVMHPVDKIITLNENDPAREAVRKIVEYKVVSIPVLNDEGVLVGMVRNCDITKTLAKLYDIPLYKLFETFVRELKGITWDELMEAAAVVTKQTTGEEIDAKKYEERIRNTTFGQAIWSCGGLEKFFAGLIKIGEIAIARRIARRR